MSDSPENIDWQHPEIARRLAVKLSAALSAWRVVHGLPTRERDTVDLLEAITFTGERLDAFQMARFLEDSRLWPSDQALVITLADSKKIREKVITEFQAELAPKLLGNQGPQIGQKITRNNGVIEFELISIKIGAGKKDYHWRVIKPAIHAGHIEVISETDMRRHYPHLFT
jgi:hypothetical protein